jgi:uroporphyrinogen-III synthase
LWLAGEQYTAIETDSVSVTIISVYQSVTLTLGSQAQACLKNGVVVALHSVRAAQILCEQMDQLGLDKHKSHIVAFSPAVAQAAGLGWKSQTSAAMPSDGALLSIAAGLCLEPI